MFIDTPHRKAKSFERERDVFIQIARYQLAEKPASIQIFREQHWVVTHQIYILTFLNQNNIRR